MDAIETLRRDAAEGRISCDRLIDLLAAQQRQLQATHQQLQAAQQQLHSANERIAELEAKLGGPPTAKLDEPFSLRSEEQRQARAKRRRQRRGRRGRHTTAEKLARAERTEAVFPDGVPPTECWLSHVRPVWRLEQGRAVLVAYQIYRGPGSRYGVIPGVLGRSEFGLEFSTEIAYLVYIVGLSFDKVCLLLRFFQHVDLTKAQADALLNRLARHWEREFDILCTLVANSMVVHADETRWSLNSVWAFLSEKARVLLFGVHKDAATLATILDPATFAGIVISDDAAVYAHFSAAQKCWAHLLRKAIKLTLQNPDHVGYRDFLDGLLGIYREACRVQRDQRFSPAGRAARVVALDDAIVALCGSVHFEELPPPGSLDDDYRLLVAEVFRLMLAQELFTFVTAEAVTQPNGTTTPVAGTNNVAERTLRDVANARKTGRTTKTVAGARRRTILTSVLESLRLYLPTFTFESVVSEVQRWWATGRSCFAELLERLEVAPRSGPAVIDQLHPKPSPSG